jgi:hypothetical protein
MDSGTLGLRRIVLALAALMIVSASLSEVLTMAMQRRAEGFEIAAPIVVLDSVSDRFPGFSIWSLKMTGPVEDREYEVTVFDPRSTGLRGEVVDGGVLHTRQSYRIVVAGTGEVISEEQHAVSQQAVPGAALDTFRGWRASRPDGMTAVWGTYQKRNEQRRYVANIVVDATESHLLIVNEDGSIVSETQIAPE